jgi:uncharacterized protein YjbI with pentapeptide repeats
VTVTGVKVSGVKISGVKLFGVKLFGVKLFGVKVTGAMVTGVEMSGLTFIGVTDPGAMVTGVEMSGLSGGAGAAVCETPNSGAVARVATGIVAVGSTESVGRTSEVMPAVKVTGDDTTAFGKAGTGATAVADSSTATSESDGRIIEGAIATIGVLNNECWSRD